jgi:hypothetical protein
MESTLRPCLDKLGFCADERPIVLWLPAALRLPLEIAQAVWHAWTSGARGRLVENHKDTGAHAIMCMASAKLIHFRPRAV